MADAKLPALTGISQPVYNDLLYVVDVSDTTDDASGSSRKMELSQLSVLPSTEISINGATTATIGRMHVCVDAGSPADYTLGLPAVSGNAGKLIGIRIDLAMTKLVTLDGNSSELIDNSLTRIMWAGESAILYCDGVSWSKIYGKTIPMVCHLTITSFGMSTVTVTALPWSTAVQNDGPLWDGGSPTIMTIKRPGRYLSNFGITWDHSNGVGYLYFVTNSLIRPHRYSEMDQAAEHAVSVTFPAAVGDNPSYSVYSSQETGGSLAVNNAEWTVTEVPLW